MLQFSKSINNIRNFGTPTLQCKSSITHHGGHLIALFFLFCYYHFLVHIFDYKCDFLDCFSRKSSRMRTNHCCHHTNIYRVVTDQDDNDGGVDGRIRRDDAPVSTARTAEVAVRSMETGALDS